MDILATVVKLVQSGLGNLAAYLAAHVLLCLLPAFFIAGGLTTLIPKEAVTRFLGRTTPKFISYPAAAMAGSLLAVCSCTIVPLFAGIYKKGAGIGPAITFLFFAPASNILALAYTGVALGSDLALARLLLSLAFGIGIGLIMAMLFSRQDAAHDKSTDAIFAGQGKMNRWALVFLLLLVALLLAGTFKVALLTEPYFQVSLPSLGLDRLEEWFFHIIPFDASKGEEGVTAQGAILVSLLAMIGLTAWKGLNNILEGFSCWTWISLSLVALTLLVGALGINPHADGIELSFTGRFFTIALLLLAVAFIGARRLEPRQIQEWLWESWRFVKQIFPLLIVGVFTVGIIRQIIRPEWIESLAGSNTILGNLAGVVFGVFMYFPTLVEVPIAKMFLSLGMHRGPLLAYLMSDPELSLQSILIISTIIGRLRAWTYVGWVALFSALAGLIYGAWVDGNSVWLLAGYVSIFLAVLSVGLFILGKRSRKKEVIEPNIAG
ncbi:MAG: permease [Anaerolineales bacterium]